MRLTMEEEEQIREIIGEGRWDAVCKVAAIAVENQLVQLKNVELKEGPREIYSRKAKYEGAKLVERMFVTLPDQVRKQKS